MIRLQYFANFVGDVAVTMSDIKKHCTEPPMCYALWGFCGVMDFKQALKIKVRLLLFQGKAIGFHVL